MTETPSAGSLLKKFPYGIYVFMVGFLVVIGLTDSIYLAISHYRVHSDVGYQSFCALSKALNCDTVSQSPASILINLPVAVWGAAGYLFFLSLVLFTASRSSERRCVWALCLVIACIFSIASMVFAWISSKIGSYCILCILTYCINLILVYLCWIIWRRLVPEDLWTSVKRDLRFLWSKRRLSIPLLTTFGVGLLLANLMFPAYWETEISSVSSHLAIGLTAEGHPWIGSEQPVLEIHEFSDYQCFQCRKMHYYLRNLVGRFPDKIRLVHRNYPMDHEFNPIVKEPFHVGSGKMALLAIHAAASGSFWKMNDRLYAATEKTEDINLKDVANDTGFDARELAASLKHEPYSRRLLLDIHQGIKLGIIGTPTYLVDGKIYEGRMPAEVLMPVIDGKDRSENHRATLQ